MSKLIQYSTFVAACEEKNLSKAAARLHLSPSAVSKQLSTLEHNMGIKLLDRSTRVVVITDLGQRFYHRCKEILTAVDEAEREVADAQEVVAGKVVLSIPKVMLHSDLMSAFTEFCELYPGIKLDLRVTNERENIIDKRIDFAFRIGALPDSRLHSKSLMTVYPVFFASPDYLKRRGTPKTLADLSKHEVLVSTAVNLSEAMRSNTDHMDNLPLDLDRYHTTDDATAIYKMVLNGLGIGVLINEAVEKDFIDQLLVRVLTRSNLGSMELNLVYHKHGQLPKILQVFKDYIIKFYEKKA